MPDTKPKTMVDVRSLARSHTVLAINTLAGIAKSPRCPPSARAVASLGLLDRGWGKAPQVHDGSIDGDIRITIRTIIEGRDRMQDVTVSQPQLAFDGEKDDG